MGVKAFGSRLRQLRRSRHLGIRTLAARLGITRSYLSHIEHGRRIPHTELARRLARMLQTDAEEFLLLAGHLPKDVQAILRRHPLKSVMLLRQAFKRKPRKLNLSGKRRA